MTDEPWRSWIPGVLNNHQIMELCEHGLITGRSFAASDGIDMSSFDLTLSDDGFEMRDGAVKPSGSDPYQWFIDHGKLGVKLSRSADGSYELKAKHTYVFRLQEKLERRLAEAGFYGQATAKSSVGRVDVLARLIADGMDKYECFDPAGLNRQSGNLYLEITPITFNVKVKKGIRLSQLRLFYGKPENVEMRGDEVFKTVFQGRGSSDGNLTVDLENESIGGLSVSAFRAKPTEGAIPLWKQEPLLDPCSYWNFVRSNDRKRLRIEETHFYILKSKERINVPEGIAIYCRASDETIGEMRIHYAGFAHPLFKGCLIFEVRGHQVHVSLADGEKMANIILYRMSQDCTPGATSTYQNQGLKLSQFFNKWPDNLELKDADGRVEKR